MQALLYPAIFGGREGEARYLMADQNLVRRREGKGLN